MLFERKNELEPTFFPGVTPDVHRPGLSRAVPHRLHGPVPLVGLRQEELPRRHLSQLASRLQRRADDVRCDNQYSVVEKVGRGASRVSVSVAEMRHLGMLTLRHSATVTMTLRHSATVTLTLRLSAKILYMTFGQYDVVI